MKRIATLFQSSEQKALFARESGQILESTAYRLLRFYSHDPVTPKGALSNVSFWSARA